MQKPAPTLLAVADLLEELHGTAVSDLEALEGGFWSTAYGYIADGRDLVLRLGTIPEGFVADRDAYAFNGPDLPVPEVLDVGDALGWGYAISARKRGDFLELAADPGPALTTLLTALRKVPKQSGRWREFLVASLQDDPASRTHGWRATLAQDPELERLFTGVERRVADLIARCPDRGDLVHSDLVNRNVLIANGRPAGVFSWKCAVRGDFLWDTAWCTFWAPWFPSFAGTSAWDLTRSACTEGDLVDAGLRHHCYELIIGASHLGWALFTDDAQALRKTAERTAEVLDRGPLDG